MRNSLIFLLVFLRRCSLFRNIFHVDNGALLDALEQYNGRERHDYWPRSPKGLGDGFRRAAPALRILGIDAVIESKPRRDGIHCCLRPGSYEVPAPKDSPMTRWRAAA